MAIKSDEVKELCKRLFDNIHFKLDCNKYINQKRKLLIVEGSTDEKFIDPIKRQTVDCVVASKVFRSNAAFSTTQNKSVNCKDAIYKLIVGISDYPSPFITYEKDIDKWDLYGLIDRDNEDLDLSRPISRLLVTDTHDLETLMMSTDDGLLFRLDGCIIPQDDIDKACFLANQLSLSRSLLRGYYDKDSFDSHKLSFGSNNVDFSMIFDADRINLQKLINYVSTNSAKPLLMSKRRKIYESVKISKQGKKLFDADGKWKGSLSDFSAKRPVDFWLTVNGHDILQLLMFVNENVCYCFGNKDGIGLNRSFEIKLIDNYDYSNFIKTELSNKMKSVELILC